MKTKILITLLILNSILSYALWKSIRRAFKAGYNYAYDEMYAEIFGNDPLRPRNPIPQEEIDVPILYVGGNSSIIN